MSDTTCPLCGEYEPHTCPRLVERVRQIIDDVADEAIDSQEVARCAERIVIEVRAVSPSQEAGTP